MMRKNNNRNGGNKHRGGSGGGGRRYQNNSGGGNRGANDGQNLQRQKHHATQQLGKYGDLARNAQINGDRVDVEYYLQHVDHYTRVLADIAAIEAERHAHSRESQIIPGGPNDPNAAQYRQAQAGDDASANESAEHKALGNEAAGNEVSTEAASSQPPRAPRPPRRQQHGSTADFAPDNGAKEANRNVEDIPLPGSILPPI
ncbi:MAG: DUF4167 domain-containing protein [Alphaproteobacteria bacterium]|nr:DUF4167 domain-containing protein [Alphaproteobacteria bacterium]